MDKWICTPPSMIKSWKAGFVMEDSTCLPQQIIHCFVLVFPQLLRIAVQDPAYFWLPEKRC